ncbi:hypothetical protein AVEN_100089-1 [Araneus ventricosus]|uniref:Uncharacterized protein n=1 Tax=Araneus ventricosus TaxID=182803 RepID=A0A4Y2J197_ARAVE|nr:hypothetical protein AVEN_100089-1 [Araneus ventricosus]
MDSLDHEAGVRVTSGSVLKIAFPVSPESQSCCHLLREVRKHFLQMTFRSLKKCFATALHHAIHPLALIPISSMNYALQLSLPLTNVSTPAAFIHRQLKWSDGYWMDPLHTMTILAGFFTMWSRPIFVAWSGRECPSSFRCQWSKFNVKCAGQTNFRIYGTF